MYWLEFQSLKKSALTKRSAYMAQTLKNNDVNELILPPHSAHVVGLRYVMNAIGVGKLYCNLAAEAPSNRRPDKYPSPFTQFSISL